MGRILQMHEKASPDSHIISIAGPRRGTNVSWRDEAARILVRRTKACILLPDFKEDQVLHPDFVEPIGWAYHHLYQAIEHGTVMLWFPKQTARVPSNAGQHYDHPYAINAERVLGLCVGAKRFNRKRGLSGLNLVVGCDYEYGRKKSLVDFLNYSGIGISPIIGNVDEVYNETVRLANA